MIPAGRRLAGRLPNRLGGGAIYRTQGMRELLGHIILRDPHAWAPGTFALSNPGGRVRAFGFEGKHFVVTLALPS